MPEFLKKWDCVWVEPDEIIDYKSDLNFASKWVGMNIFTINSETCIVDKSQNFLIKKLRNLNINVETINLPYSRYLLGGPHCTTLDTIRINS